MDGHAILEHGFLAIGVAGLGIFLGGLIYSSVSSTTALAHFDAARVAVETEKIFPAAPPSVDQTVNFSQWSQTRAQAYRASLMAAKEVPFAVVHVPKVHLRVPVYEGTDEATLNRGAGWIPSTSRPGEGGNIGIAGHRDGFFRELKAVSVGDSVELSTVRFTETYKVDLIQVVEPSDTSVLRPRNTPSVTLLTCYPFYFIGNAPQRYIVHASLARRGPEDPIEREGQ